MDLLNAAQMTLSNAGLALQKLGIEYANKISELQAEVKELKTKMQILEVGEANRIELKLLKKQQNRERSKQQKEEEEERLQHIQEKQELEQQLQKEHEKLRTGEEQATKNVEEKEREEFRLRKLAEEATNKLEELQLQKEEQAKSKREEQERFKAREPVEAVRGNKKRQRLEKNLTEYEIHAEKTKPSEKKRKAEKKLKAGCHATQADFSETDENLTTEKIKGSLRGLLSPAEMALLEKNCIAIPPSRQYKVVMLEGPYKGLTFSNKEEILEYFSKKEEDPQLQVQHTVRGQPSPITFKNYKGDTPPPNNKTGPFKQLLHNTIRPPSVPTGNAGLVKAAAAFKKRQSLANIPHPVKRDSKFSSNLHCILN